MAKARTLVGLDVHAAKIVVAVLARGDGRVEVVFDEGRDVGGGRVLRRGAASGRGRVRGRARPGMAWRGSSRNAGLSVWSRRRRRSRASGDKVKTDAA